MKIIKIGGGKDINLEGIVSDLSENEDRFIIVHGANALRDELAERLGRPKKVVTSVSGYSSVFSDEDALDVIMMAYSGLRNRRLVELCQRHGINAVGLSGLDGRLIQGRRNQGIRVKEGQKVRIIRDLSGKPRSINSGLLELLMSNDYVPVICIPIIDEQSCAVNSENDDIVSVLHETVRADTIIQLIGAPGFLDNPGDPDSILRYVSPAELAAREEQAEGRMKRKVHAIRKLFENGAARVIISDGRTEHPVKDALEGKGTVIT